MEESFTIREKVRRELHLTEPASFTRSIRFYHPFVSHTPTPTLTFKPTEYDLMQDAIELSAELGILKKENTKLKEQLANDSELRQDNEYLIVAPGSWRHFESGRSLIDWLIEFISYN